MKLLTTPPAKKKPFEPFTLAISIESVEEALRFRALANDSALVKFLLPNGGHEATDSIRDTIDAELIRQIASNGGLTAPLTKLITDRFAELQILVKGRS